MNPTAGREGEAPLSRAVSAKKVLVIGGGPAGLVAATVAAQRGHAVTLMEKGHKVGGQLLLAAFPPMKHDYAGAVRYLASQAEKAGVEILLNCEATPNLIQQHAPDVAVIATGGGPALAAQIPGSDKGNVVQAWDVLAGRVFPGPRVVIIGGGKVGCETADYLAHPVDDLSPTGNRVTILEMLNHVVLDDLTPWRSVLIQRIRSKGVRIITGATVLQILPDGIQYSKDGKERILPGVDTVVLAMGTRPIDPASEGLKGSPIQIFVIGDAKNPRNAMDAIHEGWEIGRVI